MFQIISGTSKTVSGTQNLERNVPTTEHKNVPTNSVLLGTLFQLAFPVCHESPRGKMPVLCFNRYKARTERDRNASVSKIVFQYLWFVLSKTVEEP